MVYFEMQSIFFIWMLHNFLYGSWTQFGFGMTQVHKYYTEKQIEEKCVLKPAPESRNIYWLPQQYLTYIQSASKLIM